MSTARRPNRAWCVLIAVPPFSTALPSFHSLRSARARQVFLFDKEPELDQQADARDLEAYLRLERAIFQPDSQLGAERLKVIPYLSDGASCE